MRLALGRWVVVLAAVLAGATGFGVSALAASPRASISGTWSCCGTTASGTQAAAQTWTITESGSGSLSGSGSDAGGVFANITGSESAGNVSIVTTYTGVSYTATFTGTVSADGSTMSGNWSSSSSQTGTWTATLTSGTGTTSTGTTTTTTTSTPGLRKSATQVNCYDTNPDAAGDYFQCTADVADASGRSPAMAPTGTVQFAINAGGGGGFQGFPTCNLAPSQTGGASGFCSVNYVPPSGGIPIGSQPPITAVYTGSAVFAASSGQPQTLKALQTDLCAGVYDPGCAGLVPLPTDLADLCVSLGTCLPGAQGDGTEEVTIDPDENSLVKGQASCPANASPPANASGVSITKCDIDAYLNGTASQDVIDKVQYTLNYNTYDNQVNAEKASQLQSAQSSVQAWENSVANDGVSATTLNAVNLIWTRQIKDAYNAAEEAGTDSSSVTVTLSDAFCKNNQDQTSCLAFVAAIQKSVNSSLSSLANSKASLGVNMPYKPPPPPPPTKAPLLLAQAARSSKRRHGKPEIVLAATQKTVVLSPGEKKTIYLRIPAFVRTELKHALSKGQRTLHDHLAVTVATSNGSYTTRTIPVTIHLTKKKHR